MGDKSKYSVLAEAFKSIFIDKKIVKKFKEILSSGNAVWDDFVLTIILVHKRLDELFDKTLSMYLMNADCSEEKRTFVEENILTAISFQNKITILRKIGHLKVDKIRALASAIGTIRNKCAHSRKITRLAYNNRNYKNYRELLYDVFDDYIKIGKHFDGFSNKHAKHLFGESLSNPYIEALTGIKAKK